MCHGYQDFARKQEQDEYFDRCVKVAVDTEIKRIINSATCFDCDNPLVVVETEDGIAVKQCEKCSGIDLSEMDATVKRINGLTAIIGRG